MAGFVEIPLEQGVAFNYQVEMKNDVNLFMNLVSYTINSHMRKSYSSLNTAAIFTATKIDAPNGVFQLSLTPDVTANIKYGRYVFDTTITNILDPTDKTRILEGIVTVTPGVTR